MRYMHIKAGLRSALIICAIAILLLDSAEAGERFELGLQGGLLNWSHGDPKLDYSFLDISKAMSRNNNEYFGLIIGAYPVKYWGFEFGFLAGRWDYDLSLYPNDSSFGPDSGSTISNIDCNGMFSFYGNILIEPMPGMICPYVTGGAGYMNSAFDNDFIYNYGGGIKLNISRHYMIRVDYRIFEAPIKADFLYYNTSGPSDQWGDVRIPFRDRIRFRQITIGLLYYRER